MSLVISPTYRHSGEQPARLPSSAMLRIDFNPVADAMIAMILAADLSPDDEVAVIRHLVTADGQPAGTLRESLTHTSRHMVPGLKTVVANLVQYVNTMVRHTVQAPIVAIAGMPPVRTVDYSLEVVRHPRR